MEISPNNLGAIPSIPDYRSEIVASAVAGSSATPTPSLPASLFTDFQRFGIYHQKKTPACVSHAIALLMKLWWFLKTGKIVNFSPRFLHILSGMPQHNGGIVYGPEDGRTPSVVMKVAKNFGCATETTLANNTDLTNSQYFDKNVITDAVLKDAEQYKIPGYVPVMVSQLGIRQAIQKYGGVSLLFRLGNAWWTAPNGNSSWVQQDIDPVRAPKSPVDVVSGHEVVGSGWNASLDHFVNSWSTSWSQNGESDYIFNEWDNYIIEALAIAEIPQDALHAVQGLPPANEFRHIFSKQIPYGASGQEVRALQIALSILGFNTYPDITGNYFDATRRSVLAFQLAYKVAPPATLIALAGRNVGPATLSVLNTLTN